MILNDPVYRWWTERNDQWRVRLRDGRFVPWIDHVLVSAGYPAALAAAIKAETLRYLDEVTLRYDGAELRECTGGFLDKHDDYDLPLTRQADHDEGRATGNTPRAELRAYALQLGFASYVAAVTAYFAMQRTTEPTDRVAAAERFLATLAFPLTRAVRKRLDKAGESLLDQTLASLQSQTRLHRGLARESFASFENAVTYAMRAAEHAAAEAVRTRREFTSAEDDMAEKEGDERPALGQHDTDGWRSRKPVKPPVPDVWPELYDALFPVAADAANALPADQAPRILVQLMLGGVYHKEQNTQPWSKLPWGVQPELVRVVKAAFGPNWHRQTERRVHRLMQQHGYLLAIIQGLSSWKGSATSAEFDAELPDTAELRQVDELLQRLQKPDAELVAPDANNSDNSSTTAHRFYGWECFTNVAWQATRDLVDEVVVPQPPTDLPATPDDVTVAGLEAWLGQTHRPTPPPPAQWAWVARALWQTSPINQPDEPEMEGSQAITGAEA